MSCVSSARYGLLLASLTATALPAAPLSPADQNAIEQQQKALLEQTQQQRDMLRHAASVPSLPEAAPSEPTGQCFQLRHIRLESVTVLPRSAVRKLSRSRHAGGAGGKCHQDGFPRGGGPGTQSP